MLITTLAAEQDSFVGPMVFGFLFMFVFVPIVVGVVIDARFGGELTASETHPHGCMGIGTGQGGPPGHLAPLPVASGRGRDRGHGMCTASLALRYQEVMA